MENIFHKKNSYTFPKAEKLKSRKAIELLFGTGKSFFVHPYKVFYRTIENETSSAAMAGFAVSAKNFKRAVDRNKIKRLGRETYRLQKEIICSQLSEKKMQLHVFFVFTGREIPHFGMLKETMKLCIDRLSSIIDKKNI